MTANTDTITRPSETVGPETTGSPEAQPPTTSRRAPFGWIAVTLAGLAVAVLAIVTFTGGDGPDTPTQSWDPDAEAYDREAHLEGQARTYLGTTSGSQHQLIEHGSPTAIDHAAEGSGNG